MGYFRTNFRDFNNGRNEEWAAYEGNRIPLWQGKLWAGVKAAFDEIEIDDTEIGEFSYRSHEGPAWDFLRKMAFKGEFPSDLQNGRYGAVIIPNKEHQNEYERLLQQHAIITLPFITYKATFYLGNQAWDNALIWAASHRCKKWPADSYFEVQMQNDFKGLLAELFICKLFEYSEIKFWEDFCKYLGKGDEGWDIEIRPNGQSGNCYLADSKTWTMKKQHNIGGLHNGDWYKPKVRDLIIAPVRADWEGLNTIHLSLAYLIDAESYWDFSEYVMEPNYRLRLGEWRGQKSRFCEATEFSEVPSLNKGQDIYEKWKLPMRIPRVPKPREAGIWVKEKSMESNE